ncbi:bestrophin-like domain [Longispora urticae]
MNIYLEGLLWVVGAGVVAGVLVYLQHRYLSSELRAQHNDVTGAFFEIIGVLYAVMLAFIVIAVWDTMNEAEDNSYKEANALVEVYWVGHHAPEPQRARIEALSRQYANAVVDDEWPRMSAREAVSPTGYQILDDLRVEVEGLKSADQVTSRRYQETADKLKEVVTARGTRLASVEGGVNPVLWFALIGGAVLFVAFAYLFGVPGRLAHATMVVTVTMMVVMLLYAVYQLEFPFSRATAVGPDGMRFALERFAQIGGGGSLTPSR